MYLLTDARKADEIALWLEKMANHIRNHELEVDPDRVLLVLMEGNSAEGEGDFEMLHKGGTITMFNRTSNALLRKIREVREADLKKRLAAMEDERTTAPKGA